jgi:hypothetical protein
MNDSGSFLSAQGQRRRAEIARLARAAARERRRRRRIQIRTTGTAVAGFLLFCLTVAQWPRRNALPIERPQIAIHDSTPSPKPGPDISNPSAVTVTRIETDPDITARLALPRQPARWRVVGDDDLLQTLAEAGHPAGLVRMNGQAILLLR